MDTRLTKTYSIPYYFVCEHCGKKSAVRTRRIQVSSSKSTFVRSTLSTNQYDDLTSRVNDKGEMTLRNAQWKVRAGHYAGFNGKCDYCGYHQSWEAMDARKVVYDTILMPDLFVAIGGALIWWIIAFIRQTVDALSWDLLLGLVVLLGISSLICLPFGMKARNKIVHDAQTAPVKNLPTIQW